MKKKFIGAHENQGTIASSLLVSFPNRAHPYLPCTRWALCMERKITNSRCETWF